MQEKTYLTTTQIAKLFNVQPITVYRWEKKGLIKSHRINPKGKKLFIKENVVKLLGKNDIDLDKNIKLLAESTGLEAGTKAKNIKIIKEKGFCAVPKTLVINTEVFKSLLSENNISDPLEYNWSKFDIPLIYRDKILKRIHQEFGDKPLVIRSSATCEDSPLLSFAGQYSSFLNIKGDEKIIKALSLCYASLFSENAQIYAKINGVRLEYESMAIAVQELIPPEIAGVIFTADPVNNDKNYIIVEYTKGLGDSVVSGHKKPFVKKIAKAEAKNIKDLFLKKLIQQALELEKVFGNPQDIEWGWSRKQVYIFQSRNITTLDRHPKSISDDISKKKIIVKKADIACRGIAKGKIRIIKDSKDYEKIEKGDVVFLKGKMDIMLVKKINYINAMVISGGVLSHMAVIAREFNIPCLLEPKMVANNIDNYKDKKVIVDAFKGQILLN